jgi:predicted acetyltransferase
MEPKLHFEVVPATLDQQPILANLLQLYAHDFSEFHTVDLNPEGRFIYKQLPLYWSEPNRYPFLIWIDGSPAGFALVKRGSELSGAENVWDMAEFFVLRGFRRRSIGTQVVQRVWRRLPGAWEIRVMQSNIAACRFWQRAVLSIIGEYADPVFFEKDGERWQLFSFESGPVA